MPKCRRCGQRGLFLKLNSDKNCKKCEIEVLDERIQDTRGLLAEATEAAKTEAHRLLEAEYTQMTRRIEEMNLEFNELTQKNQSLRDENESLRKTLATSTSRIEKLRPLTKAIQSAWKRWIAGDLSEAAHHAGELKGLGIEEMLPNLELNCLTIKQLKARYATLRKQVIELCTAYESRYTTKVNATLYKLMVLALEAELGNILHTLQFGKLETGIFAVRELASKYYTLACDGNQSIAPTIRKFIWQIESLYIEIVETEYEYYIQRERTREEQRALKEQMRQEAEEQKRLEQEKKKIEAEEDKYRQEINRIIAQMQQAHKTELEDLRKRLEEMNILINKIEERKSEIVNLQNGKAGTVYIISNIGAFGEHVFKIGMTRRLDPQERINELSSASVPFPFDVHAFIFSEDAVALETALHKELDSHRINKVNLRKEFFDIDIEELQKIVERIDPTAPFHLTASAEQYHQSLSIKDVLRESAINFND